MLNTVKVPKQFAPLFEKAQEYVARYFQEKKEDPSKGTIDIFGERYILVRSASLSVEFFETIAKLYEKEGEEEAYNIARQILFDIAHAIGKQDAKNFHKKMDLKDPIAKLSAGPIHFSHIGYAFVDILAESRPSPDENYCLIYDHPYAFESAAWLASGKKSNFAVCIMNAGYFSGWCEESFGIPLVSTEIMCIAKGDEACRFIMAPPSRIEGHIADYMKREPELAKRITKYEVPGFFKRKEAELFYKIIPNAIFTVDKEKRIIRWNKKAEELTGYTAEDILGKECYLFALNPCTEKCSLYSEDVVKPITSKECTIKRKDGKERIISKNVDYLKDAKGNVVGGVESFEDITERREMEAEREVILKRQRDIGAIQQSLIMPATLESKLKAITDGITHAFDADFCRIWLIKPGDLCEKGCIHAEVKEGPHVCRFRKKCLHLLASSGRYTHTNGKGHARVPFGCYKIGLIASGKEHKFLTNDVVNNPGVHNREWARELGLVSFAGYKIEDQNRETVGVLALFAKHPILPAEDTALNNFSTTVAFVVQQAVMEDSLRMTNKELLDKTSRLEIFQKMTLGREQRIMELKEEVNELLARLGEPKRYEYSIKGGSHERDNL